MNSELKPKIRFKEFTDDWEQRKFEDYGTVSMCKRIFKNETADNGEIPFYKIGTFGAQADAFISNEKYEYYKSKFSYPNKGDILLSASGTIGRIVEYNGEKAYFQDSNIVWLNHNDDIKNSFLKVLYPTVKWDGIEGSTIKRLYNSNFLNTCINVPNIFEQEKIGILFANIDNLITLHQRKCNKLIELKKSLLEKMFPQNNSIIPEIRFKGFTDDWEQCKLSTLIRKPITDGPHETPQLLTSGIPFISVEAIHDGIIDLKKCRGYISEYDDERFKQKYIPEIGDVFFTKAATIGRVAVVDKLGFNIWSPIGAIKPDFSKTISKYLYYVLQTDNIMKEALLGSNSSSQYNLSMDTIENFTINIPKSINEQVEVSKLLTNIDNLITLHQRKYDKLNKIKQSLLNDMFV